MNTLNLQGGYQAPRLWVVDFKTEGVLCASGDVWYRQGPAGDFNYTVDTDDSWA